MNRLFILAAAASTLSLGGCNAILGQGNLQPFLNDLQTCDRDYQVAFGGPSINGSAHITCHAKGAVVATSPTP